MERKSVFIGILLFLALAFLVIACHSTRHRQKMPEPAVDGLYDSEFPQTDASTALESISRSLRKLYVVAYYKTYEFPLESNLTRKDISRKSTQQKAISFSSSTESVIGTATIISHSNNRVVMLTCAHILGFPDTLLAYYDQAAVSSLVIRSMSVKEKQELYVKDLPVENDLTVLAIDTEHDIALLGKQVHQGTSDIPVFPYPGGNADELRWGSFVYVLGYPAGNLMVTRGIVSPGSNIPGVFMTDALFNKGISGGVVVAIRDGVPHFELVGIAKSVSTSNEFFLKPDQGQNVIEYDLATPYEGNVFVSANEMIKYGVTYVISMEQLRLFFNQFKEEIHRQGYYPDMFFTEQIRHFTR